jgi:hypothetical protein
MSQETSRSCERDWREIAEEAAKETNPERLSQIVKQLCNALDKRSTQNQLRRDTPNRESA